MVTRRGARSMSPPARATAYARRPPTFSAQPRGLLTFRMPVRSRLLMLALLFDRPHQAHDAVASRQRTIEDELQVGSVAEVQALLEVVMQEARGTLQVLVGSLDRVLVAVDAEIDLGQAEVGRRLDVGNRDQRAGQGRVFDLARQELGDLLTQKVIDAFDAARRHDRLISDALGGEHLHRVAFGDFVPAVEQNAALEAFADFVDVVLLAPERGEVAFPDLLSIAQVAHPIATMDDAIGDDAASDRAAAGLERRAHPGVTVDDLLVARLEHAREHLLDVLDQGVDHAVLADAHALELRCASGISFGLDVERHDQCLRSHRQVDVVDVDVAKTRVDDFRARLGLVAELFERVSDGFDAALNVSLDDQVQLLHRTRANAGEDRFKGHLGLAVALARASGGFDHCPRSALIGHRREAISCRGYAAEAEHLDWK